MIEHYAVIIRSMNVTLALISIILLMYKFVKHWPRYKQRTRDFWWVLMCWSLAVFFSTIEILMNWDTQIRVFFTLFALVLTIKVTAQPNEADHPTVTKEF